MSSVRLLLTMGLIVVGWLTSSASPIAGEEPNGKSAPAFAAPTNEAAKAAEKLPPEDRIRQALQKKIDVDYVNTPLDNLVEDLKKKLNIPIVLDNKALSEIGVEITAPVTFRLSNVSADHALRLMLRSLGLTKIITPETLLITTPEEADNRLITKVYDVWDLVTSKNTDGREVTDFVQLMDAITSCVKPQTWDAVGGPGSLASFEAVGIKALAVSQTQDVCEDIEDLFVQLRAVRHDRTEVERRAKLQSEQPPSAENPQARLPKLNEAEKAVRLALAKPISLQFTITPLYQVIAQLQKKTGVPIVLLAHGQEEATVKDISVTAESRGETVETALNVLLMPYQLCWTFDSDTLVISSEGIGKNGRDPVLLTRTYDVSDLPSYRDQSGRGVPDYDNIIDVVRSTIQPNTWDAVGGPGSMHPMEAGGIQAVVISTEWKTHRQIETLLTKLRKLRAGRVTTPDIARLPLVPNDQEMQARANRRRRDGSEVPRPVKADAVRDALIDSTNQFACDLYGQLSKRQGGGQNLFFSPCGIATGLGMVYAGARGQTAEEIDKAMHLHMGRAEVLEAFAAWRATLPASGDRGGQFVMANRLWGQKGHAFADPFQRLLQEKFGADAADVDFASSASACDAINAWTAEKTAGQIKQIVGPGALGSNTRFALTNAVYFKGQWAQTFDKEVTETVPFRVGEERIDVAMMNVVGVCRYGRVDNVRILEKPYRGGEIAMMILLPDDQPGAMAAMESLLSAEKLKNWSAALHERRVSLDLPRFKLEHDLSLLEPLAALGMSSLFKPGVADLSGVTADEQPLWLGVMLHRAQVSVDEEGTEAAAATLGGGFFGGPDPRLAIFRCDHPSVFLIRDTRTGAILFMGRLARPTPERVEKPAAGQQQPQPGQGMF